jgi:predicted acyl esterase
LRVEVTSSSHPRWERNLNTGKSAVRSDRTQIAHQTVFHDTGRPSRVTLTVARG